MTRIFQAFLWLILGSAAVFASFYLPSMDLLHGLYNFLPHYPAVAAFALLLALLARGKGKPAPALGVFLFILAALGAEFALREFAVPPLSPKTSIDPADFLRRGSASSLKGVVLSSPQGLYVFGELAATPTGHMARNFLLVHPNGSRTEAAMARIEENRILALDARTIENGATNGQAGLGEFQVPFRMDALHSLWEQKNPQNANLLPARWELYRSQPVAFYKKMILLAAARYGAAFALLLIAAAAGLSAANTLDFDGFHALGGLAFLGFAYPALSLAHFYLIEIANALINSFL